MPCKQKRLRKSQAAKAIFIDFEGRGIEGEPPVLLGVLTEEGIRQYVFDADCAEVDAATVGDCEALPIREALDNLIDDSNGQGAHLVSWSTHDCSILKELTGDRGFRWRNAIPVAKRWRKKQEAAGLIVPEPDSDNSLSHYERLIGYQRPDEQYAVGRSIKYIRQRNGVTDGVVNRWQTLLEHNKHDLLAMRFVVHHALSMDPPQT